MRRTTVLAALICCVAVFGFAACSSSSSKSSGSSGSSGCSSSASGADISIRNLTFSCSPVKAGAKVTVQNHDTVEHTVTADSGGSFDVSVNANGSVTFTAPSKAGSYKFHCKIHSQMHGTLVVT